MYDKADPPDEGRCGSFFVTGKPSFGRRSAETRLATKSYKVLQNHRKRYSGAVCLKYSRTEERRIFFGRPFLGRVWEIGHGAPPHRVAARMAAKGMSGLPLSAPTARLYPWSVFEQKPLAGIVFATFRFEKTQDWLY
jgi:hypothetical protein